MKVTATGKDCKVFGEIPAIAMGDLPSDEAEQRQRGVDDASVTVELVGYFNEQKEIKSSQSFGSSQTISKGFAIRELPSLIAEKNHRAPEKDAANDAPPKTQKHHGLETRREVGDGQDGQTPEKGTAVRELAFLISQNRHASAEVRDGRNQQPFKSLSAEDGVGKAPEKGATVEEFALQVAEKKHASLVNDDQKQGGSESQGSRDTEAGKDELRIDAPEVATGSIIEGEEEFGQEEASQLHSPLEAEVPVVLPQSGPTAAGDRVKEDGEGEARVANPHTVAAGVGAMRDEGKVRRRRKGKELQLATVRQDQNLPVKKLRGGGRKKRNAKDSENADDATRLKEVTVTAASADNNRSAGSKHVSEERKESSAYSAPASFPFKILPTLQARPRGDGSEASTQVHARKPIDQQLEQERGRDENDSPSLPDANGGDKNAEEDAERTTPRHPRWTREETVLLLAGKRKREEEMKLAGEVITTRSTARRWESISAYCKGHGVDRDVHQCRKRWSNLASDFKKIRNWEKLSAGGDSESYWTMTGDSRRKHKLPGTFDPQVFVDMDSTSDFHPRKRKHGVADGPVHENDDRAEDVAGGDDVAAGEELDPLASALESSARAMRAAVKRSIQAQIEASNEASKQDRIDRQEQSEKLVSVLGLLTDSLLEIAQRL